MRVPIEWLKEFVTIRLAPEALADRLTMAGLEVKALEGAGQDAIFEIEVTPNRADCLSIVGIAREVAAITGQKLHLSKASAPRISQSRRAVKSATATIQPQISIRIDERSGCPLYIGRLIDGVAVAPSPEWMQRRLRACGERAINNLVDITNYVLLEYGQPLHAFDFDRLSQATIIVRRAQAQEKLRTLDGVDRTLTPETLVIADGAKAVAVAGIMGGIGTEVTDATRRVLLESAYFEPRLIRRTARRLGLASESSYRFERGVNLEGVSGASARAEQLMLELAGGMSKPVVVAGKPKVRKTTVVLDVDRMNRWLGTRLTASQARARLARFSCAASGPAKGQMLRVAPPAFRPDITQPVDLYEEIGRSVGFDRLPSTLPKLETRPSLRRSRYDALLELRRVCAQQGLIEAMSWGLVSEKDLTQFGLRREQAAGILNPLNQDYAFLRPMLVIGLSRVVRHNLARGASSIRFFELGSVVRPGEQPLEQARLGVALALDWSRDWRVRQAADFYTLKGLLGAVTARLGVSQLSFEQADIPWAIGGQGSAVVSDGRVIGACGPLALAIAKLLDIDQEVWLADLSVDLLLSARRAQAATQEPPAFPAVKRDLSILVSERISHEQVARVIREQGGQLLSAFALIDRYTGSSLPVGTYSLTFSLEYRQAQRTLTAEEVDVLHQQITAQLEQTCGAKLR